MVALKVKRELMTAGTGVFGGEDVGCNKLRGGALMRRRPPAGRREEGGTAHAVNVGYGVSRSKRKRNIWGKACCHNDNFATQYESVDVFSEL